MSWAALLLVAAGGLWLAGSARPNAAPGATAGSQARAPIAVAQAVPRSGPSQRRPNVAVAASAPEPESEHAPGEHPHPITPAHERIFRENNLVAALNLALDLEDAPRLRELVAQYRAEFPEDEYRLQEGYALIADCLEKLDAAARDRAQRFWDTEIRSQTRRYVRRYCLDRELAI